MQNYHDLMRETLLHGVDQKNQRTGETCRTLVGVQLAFDMRDGFPAITTKKLAFKACRGELLGFFRGYTSAAQFRALGCKVWDANANKTPAWLANPNRKGEDDLGRIYGAQWADWRSYREVPSGDAEACDRLFEAGFGLVCDDGQTAVFRKSINQLEDALRMLLTNPSDRRIIVSGWNIAEFDLMALPPCHVDYRFVAFENPKVLHVVVTMRSWDEFLGFNIPMSALFLEIMARLAGFTAGTVTLQVANAHLYSGHFDAVREQLKREHYPAPRLILSDRIKVVSLEEVPGAFARIEPEDIWLEGYRSHDAIKAEMAA